MRTAALVLVTGVLAALAAAGGFLVHRHLDAEPAATPALVSPAPAATAELPRPDFSLPDVDGRTRHVSEWHGKVLVINFWATWCPPCLEEIPMFNALQEELGERGLQFLGVAIDDVENVRAFAEEHAMRYPTLHGQLDAIDIGKRYGNTLGTLPYTIVVGRDGAIAHTHAGPLDRATTTTLVEALL